MQMKSDWTKWAESLHKLKIDGLAAWVLDAGAPLTLFGAQLIYLTQPFLGGKSSLAIARMLEEENEAQAFACTLRETRVT